MEKLDSIIFYTIDKAIRTYRQFAQKRLKENGYSITVDQWLVLKGIMENPSMKQNELSSVVFKDAASVNRIIALLVQGGYLTRKTSKTNRRQTNLVVSETGKTLLATMQPLILANRAHALEGISEEEKDIAMRVVERITTNCAK
jgi:DNA-binding MarR family transcriptional regulator